ncbi:DUF3857 and transglutaminase domain-containing protein [Tellurirhabdus rosea]|uniref:DUF3857 and transglutaminase domain-containing protein n=1 Tax=Tellurirhabdus rosea TaxID=2674997 RepID=UPI002258299F|nr:DUF3857 and transglutaminase domain-containing protein [Tellurirhabdus rosea]
MKQIVLLTALLLNGMAALAQESYRASAIPAGLGEGAGAVLRKYEETFTVKSPGEAVETVHSVVTILNEKGSDRTSLTVVYDKFSKVSDIEGTLYDASGKVIKRLKRADIQDLSAIGDEAFYADYRQKTAGFSYAGYPFTVEFRYERTTRNLLFYPEWFPLSDPDMAVQSASLKVTLPAGQSLRYRTMNGLPEPAAADEGTGRSYTWQLADRKVREREPYNLGYDRLGPGVLTAPSELELESFKGVVRTWKEFGKLVYDINSNRDELPETTKTALADLLKGETDPRKKVEKVYGFMQKHTRYVLIKLGLGGWQTFPAATVAEKGYGDCKALSNYTAALLKAAGIRSHLALVMAGDDEPDVLTDFPAARFNHMILCVPLAKDTVWLECTSPLNAAGYMGSFTGNRHALLLTPEGGKLVRTPTYKPTDSRLTRRIDLKIGESGDANAEVVTEYAGLQAEDHEQVMHLLAPDEQKKWLYRQIRLPSYDIRAFSFEAKRDVLPKVTEKLSLLIPNGASRSGTRLFLNPNLLSAIRTVPTDGASRKTAFQLPDGYVDVDTVVCQLPPHTTVESLFSPVEYTSKFGNYSATVRQEGEKLIYIRRLQAEGGTFPPEAYPEYMAFRQKLVKFDRMQVVLKIND